MRRAVIGLCTMNWRFDVGAPRTTGIPTIPSLPIMPTSMLEPFDMFHQDGSQPLLDKVNVIERCADVIEYVPKGQGNGMEIREKTLQIFLRECRKKTVLRVLRVSGAHMRPLWLERERKYLSVADMLKAVRGDSLQVVIYSIFAIAVRGTTI